MARCDKCGSDRVISVLGKTNDCFSAESTAKGYDGYVPSDIGIGGGDEMEFSYCLQCGKIQGEFPLPPASIEE